MSSSVGGKVGSFTGATVCVCVRFLVFFWVFFGVCVCTHACENQPVPVSISVPYPPSLLRLTVLEYLGQAGLLLNEVHHLWQLLQLAGVLLLGDLPERLSVQA